MSLWLVGAGAMAQQYAKVLEGLRQDFEVIGRGSESAATFAAAGGRTVRTGGLKSALATAPAPEQAIVAVGVENLAQSAIHLIDAGTRRILIEKPGGMSSGEVGELSDAANKSGAQVLVAYNRRFYSSVAEASRLIADDGGAVSCNFEFTEWSHVIAPLTKGPGVKQAWFLANSTHVVDLAFHLCGFPADWSAWRAGSLSWHEASARFCGAGVTEDGVLFSYNADWEAPGRWGVEVLTRKRRFILRPMEELQVMMLGSVRLERVEIDNQADKRFKPGLFSQTKAFLDRDDDLLCTIEEQVEHCAIYDRMAGYADAGQQ